MLKSFMLFLFAFFILLNSCTTFGFRIDENYLAGCETKCQYGWKEFGDRCFFNAGVTKMFFDDAEKYCHSLNATLITVQNASVNAFLHEKLKVETWTWLDAVSNGSKKTDFHWRKPGENWQFENWTSLTSYKNNVYVVIHADGYWSWSEAWEPRFIACEKPGNQCYFDIGYEADYAKNLSTRFIDIIEKAAKMRDMLNSFIQKQMSAISNRLKSIGTV